MKKITLRVLLCLLLLITTACTANTPNVPSEEPVSGIIPEWTLTVVMPDGSETAFTNSDAAKLTAVTIDATTTNKNGESSTSSYTGVKLADILGAVGVSDFSGVAVVAADDFSADYSKELALADDTILAWDKNGEVLTTEPPLQMAPAGGTGNQFVKSTAKIVVQP